MKEIIKNHFESNWQNFYGHYLQDLRKASSDEWMTCCPFHNDSRPSFSANAATGQWQCFGCDEKGDPFHFYAKFKRLNILNDFPKILEGICNEFKLDGHHSKTASDENDRPKIINTYDYTDEKGNLLFQVVRFEPKDFRQRRPKPGMEKPDPTRPRDWIWRLNGTRRVLYNLPAVKKSAEVLLCEGEKDADHLIALKFVATTAPGGAGKWSDDYSETLKGKDVVILPDNDKSGRDHAKRVAQELYGKAASVKILELPNLREHGDVSEWIQHFDDSEEAVERLSIKIESAVPYEPPKPYFSINELMSMRFEDLPPIIGDGFLPASGSLLLSGRSGTGKSLLVLEWSFLLSLGWDILDMEVPIARRVLIFSAEGDLRNLQFRMNQIMNGHGINSFPDNLMFAKMDRRYNVEKEQDEIRNMIRELSAEVFVMDPLASFHMQPENDNMAMRVVLDTIRLNLAQQTGAAAMVVHHFGKSTDERGRVIETSRGAQAIQDAIDTEIHLIKRTAAQDSNAKLWLKYPKFRYRGHKPDLLIERDEFFNHKIISEDVKCPPEAVRTILQENSGKVASKTKLVKLLRKELDISEGTAKEAIRKALDQQLIFEGNPGKRGAISLQIDMPKKTY